MTAHNGTEHPKRRSTDRGLRSRDNQDRLWLLIITVVVFFALVRAQEAIDSNSHAQEVKLHKAAVLACRARNASTAVDNTSHYADYNFDNFILQRFLKPTKTETASQKTITAQFRPVLVAALYSKTWSTLFDCATATATAKLELEIKSIAQYGAPPSYVTNLKNAVKISPYKSLP